MKNKHLQAKRSIRINFNDGTFQELELERAASVKTSKSMINFDRMDNGKWRLIYDETLIPDFTKIHDFEIIRA